MKQDWNILANWYVDMTTKAKTHASGVIPESTD
jgi:hypothetical protein